MKSSRFIIHSDASALFKPTATNRENFPQYQVRKHLIYPSLRCIMSLVQAMNHETVSTRRNELKGRNASTDSGATISVASPIHSKRRCFIAASKPYELTTHRWDGSNLRGGMPNRRCFSLPPQGFAKLSGQKQGSPPLENGTCNPAERYQRG